MDNLIEVIAGLDDWAVQVMNQHNLAGMALGVVKGGKLVYGKGFGYADMAADKPVTTQSVFRIASISKSFTAVGLMQLWEQEKFKLDEPVNKYLTAFQVLHPDPQAPPITFRHLLTHTAGIGETRDLRELIEHFYLKTNPSGSRQGQPVIPLGEYTSGLLVADVYPDEKWAYANLGYATIGQVIEDISGKPFPEYMIEHVFEPLGMHHSDYLFSNRVSDNYVQGYEVRKGQLKPVEPIYLPRMGARSVQTNLEDMALYASALMNGGRNENGAVLQAETLELMFSPHYRKDRRFLFSMGLGFYIDHMEGVKVVGHDGNIGGFCSNLLVAPSEDLALILLINNTFTENAQLANGLMRKLLGVPGNTNRLPHPGITESPHTWHELCGFYGPTNGFLSNYRKWLIAGGEVEVYEKDGHLMMRSLTGLLKHGLPMFAADPEDALFFESTMGEMLSQVAFKRNSDGIVDHFHAAGGEFLTFYKRPFKKSLKFRVFALLGGLVAAGIAIFGYNLVDKEKRR